MRSKNRSEARRLLRRRLEEFGYRPEQIVAEREAANAQRIEAQERAQRHAEQEAELDAIRREARAPVESPDDSKYRPARYDPLTVGVARATGETAKAVRRGKTITAWQYDERTNEADHG